MSYDSSYYQRNRERLLAKAAAYRAANRDQVRARVRAWQLANPEKAKVASRVWKEKNRDRVKLHRVDTREQHRVRSAAWSRAHPEARRYWESNRRARKAGAAGTCTSTQLQARIDFYGGLCWVPGCGKPYEAIDHVLPLAKGGSNWPANLRPICKSHNSRKRSKSLTDFLPG